MYERFYGFSEGPFESGPDPRFLYLTPGHSEAFSGMLSGVRERKGITVITGDPGIGKTTLIRALLSELDEKVRTAFIVFTLLEFGDLLKSILHELGIPAGGEDTFALLEAFYLYLSERPQDEIVTIIIDEAQGLDTSVLEDLVRLWAGPDPQYLQPQIVLVGHPELEAKLDSQELRSLREKIAVRRHISPLTRRESSLFIDHRLRIVGSSSSEVFKPEAIDRICDCAEGNLRVITTVCDGSLLIGYAKYKRKIDAKIVNEAIQDLRLSPPGKAKRRLPEPLPAEEPRPEEFAPEPVPVARPRWSPVYQLLEWVRSLKPALHPVQVRTLRWSPVYQLLEWVRSLKPVPHRVYQLLEWVRSLKPVPHPVYQLLEWVRSLKPVPHRVYQLLEWVRSLKSAVHPTDGREEPAPVLTTESVLEPLTLESSPEPLQAEGSGREEPVPEPVPVPQPRWRPVYQTLTGALLGMVALGLFDLFIWDRAPRERMTVKDTRTVIAEKGSTLSVLAEQNQGLVPVPSTSVKRARPQRLVHKQGARPQGQRLTYKQEKPPQPLAYDEVKSPQRLAPYRLNDAEQGALLLKEDAAWRVLQR